MLLLYILWDDWPILRISASNKQLQEELEYTLLKPDCHSWWIKKCNLDDMQWNSVLNLEKMLCDESWVYCYDRVPSGSMLALPDPEGKREQTHPQTFDDPFFWQHWHGLRALGSHWTDSQQGILCWGFKGVQKEIPSEEASTLQIGPVAFPPGQCTSQQPHPSHRLFDQDGHHESSSPSL